MSGTAILCSGQGSQGPQMFDLLADAAEASSVFQAAALAFGGRDPRSLVRELSHDDLHQNKIGQLLCCTQALAAWAVLGGTLPEPLVIAGYSVGELAAWGVAGLFNTSQVLDLACQRAIVMDAETMEPSGLAAIHGISQARLQSICYAEGASIAIVNGNNHFLVGGTRIALAQVMKTAAMDGARQSTVLPVFVPSHTPSLKRASERFNDVLRTRKTQALMPPGVRLLSGIDGNAVYDLDDGLDKLALQIQHTINWSACMDTCQAAGVKKVIELGPGNALTRMMQVYLPGGRVHSLSEFRSLSGIKRWIED